jgi:hypothetical protein
MELTYVEKLRAQFAKVKLNADIPPDVTAMAELQRLLNNVTTFDRDLGRQSPFQGMSQAITKAIADIVDGRIQRVLDGLDCEQPDYSSALKGGYSGLDSGGHSGTGSKS